MSSTAILLRLLAYAAGTAALETPVVWFLLRRYRLPAIVPVAVLTNLITNLTLNSLLLAGEILLELPVAYTAEMLILEVLVVAAEYGIYAMAWRSEQVPRQRLLQVVVLANSVTLGTGLLLWIL